MRLFQALPLVVLLASGTALADFPSGEAAYKGKDYGSAFSLLKPEAEASNANAQYYLGVMLRRGDGVQKDANAAADWFLKAAEQGHPEAQSTIAALYRLGEGVPQDYSKAMHWYLEAARQGFENAQYRIALLYRDGQGSPENIAEAYKWAYMSAMQSQPEPVRLRDKLAKQLSAAQIQSAHQEAATFLADVPARKAEAKKRLEASLSPVPQPVASPEAPSNNSCSQAATPIDALKCLDPELVKLDTEVAQLYRDGLITTKGVGRNAFIQLHRQWSAKVADACGATMGEMGSKTQASGKITCVKDLYVTRIEEMSNVLEEGEDKKAEQTPADDNVTSSRKAENDVSHMPILSQPQSSIKPSQNYAMDQHEDLMALSKCSGFMTRLGARLGPVPKGSEYGGVKDLAEEMTKLATEEVRKYPRVGDNAIKILKEGADELDHLWFTEKKDAISAKVKVCILMRAVYSMPTEKKPLGSQLGNAQSKNDNQEDSQPYKVTVSCENQGEVTQTGFCFERSQLEVNSDMSSEVYHDLDFMRMREYKDGVHLSVKPPFLIEGMNTSKFMTLRVKIFDNDDEIVFNKAVGPFGIIKVKDK